MNRFVPFVCVKEKTPAPDQENRRHLQTVATYRFTLSSAPGLFKFDCVSRVVGSSPPVVK
jgi:hypothetical protein